MITKSTPRKRTTKVPATQQTSAAGQQFQDIQHQAQQPQQSHHQPQPPWQGPNLEDHGSHGPHEKHGVHQEPYAPHELIGEPSHNHLGETVVHSIGVRVTGNQCCGNDPLRAFIWSDSDVQTTDPMEGTVLNTVRAVLKVPEEDQGNPYEVQGNQHKVACSANDHAQPYRRIDISVFLGVTDAQAVNDYNGSGAAGMPQPENGRWYNANTWAGVRRHEHQTNHGVPDVGFETPGCAIVPGHQTLFDEQAMAQLASQQLAPRPYPAVETPMHPNAARDVVPEMGMGNPAMISGVDSGANPHPGQFEPIYEFDSAGAASLEVGNEVLKMEQYLGQPPSHEQYEQFQQHQHFQQQPPLAPADLHDNCFVQPHQVLRTGGLQSHHNDSAVPSPVLRGSAWTSRAVTPNHASRSTPAPTAAPQPVLSPTKNDKQQPKKKAAARPKRARTNLSEGSRARQPRKRQQLASKKIKNDYDAALMDTPMHNVDTASGIPTVQGTFEPSNGSTAFQPEQIEISGVTPGSASSDLLGGNVLVEDVHISNTGPLDEDMIEQRLADHIGREVNQDPADAFDPAFVIEQDVEIEDSSLPSEKVWYSQDLSGDLGMALMG